VRHTHDLRCWDPALTTRPSRFPLTRHSGLPRTILKVFLAMYDQSPMQGNHVSHEFEIVQSSLGVYLRAERWPPVDQRPSVALPLSPVNATLGGPEVESLIIHRRPFGSECTRRPMLVVETSSRSASVSMF
jgi:hypothetical protein